MVLSVFSLNGVLFYACSYQLLHPHYHLWLGPLAAFVAAVYLAFGIFLHRQAAESKADERSVVLALGIALTFLTLAIPIQFTGFTITIAWAIQAAALTWIGSRLQSGRAVVGGVVVFALVALRLLLFETEMLPDPATYSVLWNSRFFTFAASAVAMLLASYWASKILQAGRSWQPISRATFFYCGACVSKFSVGRRARQGRIIASALRRLTISLLFGVYAVVLVSAGRCNAHRHQSTHRLGADWNRGAETLLL